MSQLDDDETSHWQNWRWWKGFILFSGIGNLSFSVYPSPLSTSNQLKRTGNSRPSTLLFNLVIGLLLMSLRYKLLSLSRWKMKIPKTGFRSTSDCKMKARKIVYVRWLCIFFSSFFQAQVYWCFSFTYPRAIFT